VVVLLLELEVLSWAITMPALNTNNPMRIPKRFMNCAPPWRKPADRILNPSYLLG
jgi:hypothetical protein